MSADNVPYVPASNIPSAVQFNSNKDIHKHTKQQELDCSFLGNDRRPWIQAKPRLNQYKEQEAIKTLMGTAQMENSNGGHINKLIEEKLNFRDLASLTDEDLKMFGFASKKQRNELINMFTSMPNQDPSYDSICKSSEANTYNNQIVNNAANHIMYLRSSLAATNYKLQVMPPEDVIVGDKRYASRFALEALNSVQSISEELAKDLRKLDKLTSAKKEKENGKERNAKILYYTAIALGAACIYFWLWSRPSNSNNLENISLRI